MIDYLKKNELKKMTRGNQKGFRKSLDPTDSKTSFRDFRGMKV